MERRQGIQGYNDTLNISTGWVDGRLRTDYVCEVIYRKHRMDGI